MEPMSGHSIHREVLRLAVPSILANITVPLVGIVDTAIAGHISNAAAIGGIAVGSMLFDLLYWNFGFLRTGTAGLTAQAWGRQEGNRADGGRGTASREAEEILTQAVVTALGGAAVILLLQWVFLTAALALVPCSVEVASFARQYFFIRVWAAPATLSLMALRGWFIGMQNTVVPMVTDLVVNGVNMLASWLLAVYTPLGAMGVAWGTLAAQYAGLAVAVAIVAARYRPSLRLEALRRGRMRRLFVLNANLFVRSLCMMVVYVGFTSLAAGYGDTELAVSSIMMKLFLLFSYFIDGFAYAGEALTGRFVGRHDGAGLRSAVRVLFVWATGVGLACTVVYGVAGEAMTALMTNDATILSAARPYRVWLALMPIASSLAFLWDGIFVGAADGAALRNAMVVAASAFLLTYLLLFRPLGIQALYAAYFAHLVARTLWLTLLWKRTGRRLAGYTDEQTT